MNDFVRMLADSVEKVYRSQVSAARMAELEEGRLPAMPWQVLHDNGLDRLMSESDAPAAELAAGLYQIAYLTGYFHAPVPILETIVARALLRQAGLEAPEGLGTVALAEPGSLVYGADGSIVSGTLAAVPWGRHADFLVVAPPAGAGAAGDVLLVPTRAGVAVREHHNLAGEPRDDLQLAEVPCVAGRLPADQAEDAALWLALAAAARLTGACRAVQERTVRYAAERVQFGRPIGKFQAVQQQIAILAGETAKAEAATLLAFRSGRPHWHSVAVAKIQAGAAAGQVARIGHQVHGAIGVTHEYPLHYWTRRLWAWRAEYGNESWWAERLGRHVCALPDSALWPFITAVGEYGGQAAEREAA